MPGMSGRSVPAGRDQDRLGRMAPSGDLDRVRIDQNAAPLDDLDAALCSMLM